MNGAHLIRNKNIWKIFAIHKNVLVALNMQIDSWNIFNLHQIWKIKKLQLMELIPKKRLTIQVSVLLLWFFKDVRYNFFNNICTHCGLYYCVFTLMAFNLKNLAMWWFFEIVENDFDGLLHDFVTLMCIMRFN